MYYNKRSCTALCSLRRRVQNRTRHDPPDERKKVYKREQKKTIPEDARSAPVPEIVEEACFVLREGNPFQFILDTFNKEHEGDRKEVNLQSRVNHHQTLLITLIKIAALPPGYQIGNRHDLHLRYRARITERKPPPKGGGLPLSRSLMSNHLSSSRLKGGPIKNHAVCVERIPLIIRNE